MSFILHGNIILWFTTFFVVREEAAIATLKDIDFGVVEFGVLMHVEMSIAIAKMESPDY